MAESNQVAKLNHTHERILDWLVQNPEKSMRECADAFGYTQAWLSTVVHSDAFQVQLSKLNGDIHSRVAADIPARMAAITDIVLDKLANIVAETEDKDFLLETGDKILARMGYGVRGNSNNTPAPQVQNNFIISRDMLSASRQKFGKVVEHEAQVINNDTTS
jgi:hypothetical protein